jgi:hypothetical protein
VTSGRIPVPSKWKNLTFIFNLRFCCIRILNTTPISGMCMRTVFFIPLAREYRLFCRSTVSSIIHNRMRTGSDSQTDEKLPT